MLVYHSWRGTGREQKGFSVYLVNCNYNMSGEKSLVDDLNGKGVL